MINDLEFKQFRNTLLLEYLMLDVNYEQVSYELDYERQTKRLEYFGNRLINWKEFDPKKPFKDSELREIVENCL